jgi:hypothetical protein
MKAPLLRHLALGALLALPGACQPGSADKAPGHDTAGTQAPGVGAARGDTVGTTPGTAMDSLGQRPEDAVATVRTYLAALVARDYARAAALLDAGAAGGGDSAAFAHAHGDTTVSGFEVGEPGDVGAAAGSRYVEVPVVMRGATPDRPPLLLHGRVTLRRSVVDGATDAQRRWRISRIEWSSNAKPAQQ